MYLYIIYINAVIDLFISIQNVEKKLYKLDTAIQQPVVFDHSFFSGVYRLRKINTCRTKIAYDTIKDCVNIDMKTPTIQIPCPSGKAHSQWKPVFFSHGFKKNSVIDKQYGCFQK